MQDIRKKKLQFHQSIRIDQRSAFRAKVRKQLTIQQKRSVVLQALNEAFTFCPDWQINKSTFWKNFYLQNPNNFDDPYRMIDQTCQNLKQVIGDFEKDEDSRIQISYFLLENLPYLFPSPQVYLKELPKQLIELCMHIFSNEEFSTDQKQEFVQQIPYETLNRCFLNYFCEYWNEIKFNKCSDIVIMFFYQVNKHKDIFKKFTYNQPNYEQLLNTVVNFILCLSYTQRQAYEKLEFSFSQLLQNRTSQNPYNWENDINNNMDSPLSEQEKLFYLMKNSIFLSNLLLLSPQGNFDIKLITDKLKKIALYLYRKVLINEQNIQYRISAQFCISVLISQTANYQTSNFIQIMGIILKNSQERSQKQRPKINQSEQVEVDQHIESKQEAIQYDNIAMLKDHKNSLLNRTNLLMIYEMSQNLKQVKYQHIQKWIKYQMKHSKQNILKLQHQSLISCFFKILINIIHNESKQTYKSYGYNQTYNNTRKQEVIKIKIRICKLITKNGFNQLFAHQNMKAYSKQLCDLIHTLAHQLSQAGDVSIALSVLSLSQQLSMMEFNTAQQRTQNLQISQLSSFKVHVYTLTVGFLQKAYKFLTFQQKEKLLLMLIFANYFSLEDCRKYLTFEQIERLRLFAQTRWQMYEEVDEEDLGFEQDQSNENAQYGYQHQNNQYNQNYDINNHNQENQYHVEQFEVQNSSYIDYSHTNQQQNYYQQSNNSYYGNQDTQI